MRTEYKVVKPFGCAKRDDIFKTEDGIEYVMESTKGNDKYTNSRYMMNGVKRSRMKLIQKKNIFRLMQN